MTTSQEMGMRKILRKPPSSVEATRQPGYAASAERGSPGKGDEEENDDEGLRPEMKEVFAEDVQGLRGAGHGVPWKR